MKTVYKLGTHMGLVLALLLIGAPRSGTAADSKDLPPSTLSSASATTTTAPAPPAKTMPLAPKLPVIEQLTRMIFPGTAPKIADAEVAAPEKLCRAFIEANAQLHFTLTDYQVREAFRTKWLERAKNVKTLDEADTLNEEIFAELKQRFDYYRRPAGVKTSNQRKDPKVVGIGVSVELVGADAVVDGLPEKATFEDTEKLMTITAERPFVLNPFKNGPGAQAGLQKGDVLVQVDGKDILGKTRMEVITSIKGTEGTTVELTVRRKVFILAGLMDMPVKVKVVRQPYIAPVVHVQNLPDGVSHIKLDNFVAENAWIEFSAALQDAAKVKDGKIIVDLRDNGGGRLDHAINIIAGMLSEGTIVTLRQRSENTLIKIHYTATLDAVFTTQPAGWNASQIHYSAAGRQLLVPTTMPIVILINENSASASELTSGCLQFHKRGIVVGENSHGKGVGQRVIELPEGRECSITTFFFDPADRPIDFEGITPDKVVSLEPTYTRIKELRGELRGTLTKIAETKKRLVETPEQTAANEKRLAETPDADKQKVKDELAAAAASEKQKVDTEVAALEATEKTVRAQLLVLHTELRDDDAQLHEARLQCAQEHARIVKEEAAKKVKRDEIMKKKLEEWEKEKKEREELKKKGAGASASAAA